MVPDRLAVPLQRQISADLGAAVRLLRQRGRAAEDRDRHAGGGSVHRLAASPTAWPVPSSLRPKRRGGTVTPGHGGHMTPALLHALPATAPVPGLPVPGRSLVFGVL